MSQTITSQTIISWAIRKATFIREIALERKKNNSSIGEKLLNPVETKEEN